MLDLKQVYVFSTKLDRGVLYPLFIKTDFSIKTPLELGVPTFWRKAPRNEPKYLQILQAYLLKYLNSEAHALTVPYISSLLALH